MRIIIKIRIATIFSEEFVFSFSVSKKILSSMKSNASVIDEAHLISWVYDVNKKSNNSSEQDKVTNF